MELELRDGMPAGAIVYQWLDRGVVRVWLNVECPHLWADALERAGIDVHPGRLPQASRARSAS